MTGMTKLLWLETPDNPQFWVDPQWHILTVTGNDTQTYKLIWATNPEPIVLLALKNPDIHVVKDSHGKRWTGTQLLHIINNSKMDNRIYTQIGEYF